MIWSLRQEAPCSMLFAKYRGNPRAIRLYMAGYLLGMAKGLQVDLRTSQQIRLIVSIR